MNRDGRTGRVNGWRFIHLAATAPWVHAPILGPNRSQVKLISAGLRQKPAIARIPVHGGRGLAHIGATPNTGSRQMPVVETLTCTARGGHRHCPCRRAPWVGSGWRAGLLLTHNHRHGQARRCSALGSPCRWHRSNAGKAWKVGPALTNRMLLFLPPYANFAGVGGNSWPAATCGIFFGCTKVTLVKACWGHGPRDVRFSNSSLIAPYSKAAPLASTNSGSFSGGQPSTTRNNPTA